MGAVKSLTHAYTSNQYLLWYIEKNNLEKADELLHQKPAIVNETLSVNYKTTPLHRAASNGNLQFVRLFIEKYNADINAKTRNGETALIGATKRNRIQIVQYLLHNNANTQIYSNCSLKAIDYAILMGLYEMALLIYKSLSQKTFRNSTEYFQLGEQYKYRYVNYAILIDALQNEIQPDNVKDFLTKPKKVLEDPVVDPREDWKKWFLRNLQFKDPPLVERSDLPEQLQPQNSKLGRLSHLLTKLTISPISQKPSLHPRASLDAMSDVKMHEMAQQSLTEQIAVKSLAK